MVLVTGGTGLVGSHLLLQLVLSNTRVKAIYRTKAKLQEVQKIFSYYSETPQFLFDKIDWVKADILDIPSLEIAFKNVDFVYHAAALISFDPNDFDKLERTNVKGTANVVNLCIAHKVKKLCYLSTIGTIGRSLIEKKADETNEWSEHNTNVYALTKYAAEIEVWRGSQENLPVVILNPGVILGPGFWNKGSGKLFRTVAKGRSYYPPGGTGFVTVSDVVQLMLQLMESNIHGERFIVVGQNLTFNKIMSAIAKEFGRKLPYKMLKIWQLQLGRYGDWFLNLITGSKRSITKNAIYSLQHPEIYDASKIKSVLNFEFEPLQNTIKLSCEKFTLESS